MNQTALSFEFFPTRTEEGRRKQAITRKQLSQYQPAFFSCTYGAGGTNVGKNLEVLKKIKADGKCTPVTHFTCVANTKEGIKDQLQTYLDNGIDHMLALRGDIPFG